jgi:LMBR1 domain-containing protein 1
MGSMAFFGWFLLLLFGGVGISALPIDLIYEFMNRP